MNTIIKIISNKYIFVILIVLLLAIIPFFWFKPGYIDIGGDSSRLYFYDPINFIKSFSLNPFWPDTLGVVNNGIYTLPFSAFLAFFKIFLDSYQLITFFNSLTLILSFLSVFLISFDLLKLVYRKNKKSALIYYCSILAGIFYIFIPLASLGGWDLPLIIFPERFIYPLFFFFTLRYLLTSNIKYALGALFISLVFAQNFSWVALPNIISFFLMSLLIFISISFSVKKICINVKELIAIAILFFLLQAFQLVPILFSLFQRNSSLTFQLNQGGNIGDIINYVTANAEYTQKGFALLGLSPYLTFLPINISLVFFPLLVVFLFIKNKKIFPVILGLLFLVQFFIITGNITNSGFSIFKDFFHLPGFIMFRNFFGKGQNTFLFLYSLVIGFSLYTIFQSVKNKYLNIIISFLFVAILISNALPFLQGKTSNRVLTDDTGVSVKARLKMDSQFKDVLLYYRNNITSARNLSFPFIDFNYQIVPGESKDGAYLGPSMIAYLTGTTDIGPAKIDPFISALYKLAQQKNYVEFSNIFPLLNFQTVFYDSSKYIYDVFTTFPYNEAKEYMPKTQDNYIKFVQNLPLTPVKTLGSSYHIFRVNNSYYLPRIYIAKNIFSLSNYNSSEAVSDYVLKNFRMGNSGEIRNVFLKKAPSIKTSNIPQIVFQQINSSKYLVQIKNASKPYVLIFSQEYNPDWKIYIADSNEEKQMQKNKIVLSSFSKTIQEVKSSNVLIDPLFLENLYKKPIASNQHFLANAYANAWYITPSDVGQRRDYTLVLELTDQRFIDLSMLISLIALLSYIFICAKAFLNK